MYQVNFSEQSMKELNQLDITKQMEIAEIISSITKEALANPTEALQSFHRDKTVYYRVRANDFRIYFELKDEQLFAHYILHKNTLSDFIFRTKLPVNEEFLAEQEDSFWKYLDSLK
jgi:mRNA interferase RelE/StbE